MNDWLRQTHLYTFTQSETAIVQFSHSE